MDPSTPHWYDDEAGPVVRLYAMTSGRARTVGVDFDLMSAVQASATARPEPSLSPEQQLLLRLCRHRPQTLADIASESDLPVGVVRVLLGDLLSAGHVHISRPVRPTQLPDQRILREVIDGLRAL
jgi:hypothetical protein